MIVNSRHIYRFRPTLFPSQRAARTLCSVEKASGKDELPIPSATHERLEQLVEEKMPSSESGDTKVVQYTKRKRGGETTRWQRFLNFWRGTSIDTAFDSAEWQRHQSSWRHFREVAAALTLSSQLTRRVLFPDLATVGVISSAVCWYNQHPEAETKLIPGFDLLHHHEMMALPPLPFTLSAMVVGLLVTFRTQESHKRYVEARQLWGTDINVCRDIASLMLTRTQQQDLSQTGFDRRTRLLAQPPDVRRGIKLLQTYMHTKKYHLTTDGCNADIEISGRTEIEIRADVDAALQLELDAIWNLDDIPPGAPEHIFVARLMGPEGRENRPLYTLNELNRVNARLGWKLVASGDATDFSATMLASRLDDRVRELQHTLGGCERILRQPIYSPYTKHTSRFLTAWCCAMPLALYPVVGPLGTVPASVVLAYMLLGIEEIGSRCEEPFSVLPLWQFCQTVDRSVEQLLVQDDGRSVNGVEDLV